MIQLSRHYGIPSCSVPFITTDCQMNQIMSERSAALIMYALSGVSEIGGAGSVDGVRAMSPIILVIDDELAAYTHRIMEGFEIDRERLAVEAINRVGHKGSFLDDPHTLQFLRQERHFKPELFDWRAYETWNEDRKTIVERAREKMKAIQASHEIPPIEEPLQMELNRIIKAAEME